MIKKQRPTIPENFPSSFLAAARIYREQDFVIFPVNRHNEGSDKEKGKKPKCKGYRNLKHSDNTDEYLTRHWDRENPSNIGLLLTGNQVAIDLDSKTGDHRAILAIIEKDETLSSLPRERTSRGFHLYCLCQDLPTLLDNGRIRKTPLTGSLSEDISVEVMSAGMTVTASPSKHRTGLDYQWEITGEVPEIPWDTLCKIFGFPAQPKTKPGRPKKEKPWWSKWKQDLRTLQLAKALEKMELLGECLDSEAGKYAVRCPWESEHSGNPSAAPMSDTVIFTKENSLPGFKCLHAHCTDRTIGHLLDFIEETEPGIIAEHCTEDRVWSPDSKASDGREKVLLPAAGRSFSQFAEELGRVVGSSYDLFRRGRDVVEVSHSSGGSENSEASLVTLNPRSAVTSVERKAELGTLKTDDAGDTTFVVKSMTESVARLLLESGPFLYSLPAIDRVLSAPIPRMIDGKLVYPTPGYDPVSKTWLDPNAPRLHPMSVDEALNRLLGDLLCGSESGGFCWRDEQAQLHALARLVTPFIRGLINWARGPIWIFAGNREGCGKDTCSDLAPILYTGASVGGAPLSKDSDDELRKRITSAIKCCKMFFHLANLKGFLNFPSLEAATDAIGVWEDRLLNSNDLVSLLNEIEFSLSANHAQWTPDLERRCRQIQLHVPNEHLNDIQFRHPDIRAYARENRDVFLSAINALVVNWVSAGCPDGRTRFHAFPSWGRVIGGIFASCGLGDPCLPHLESESAGDQETRGMRLLYETSFEKFGDKPVEKSRFLAFVKSQPLIVDKLDWIDLTERGGMIKLGRLLAKFDRRQLGDITMTIDSSSKNHKSYRFKKSSPGGSRGYESNASVDGETTPLRRFEEPSSINTKTLDSSGRTSPTSHPPAIRVTNLADLRELTDYFTGGAPVACYLQSESSYRGEATTPDQGDHHDLILYQKGTPVFAIDLTRVHYDLSAIRPLLQSATIVTYDGKQLVRFLRARCNVPLSDVRCLHTAQRLLAAGRCSLCMLDTLVSEFRNEQSSPGIYCENLRSQLYAASGIVDLLKLQEFLTQKIEEARLQETWRLENSIIPVVVKMEQNGIPFDEPYLHKLADESAPGAATLHRHLGSDHRVRAKFDPLGAETGRFSCSNPNLQGVPRGQVRESVRAPSGRTFINADFAHIELRIAAYVAQAESMIQAFESGSDIHAVTASRILEVPIGQINAYQRGVGKAVNFGLIYGQTPKGLQKSAAQRFGLDLTLSDAARFCRGFFAAYPEFHTWHKACKKAASNGAQECRTILGRRRLLPDDLTNWKRAAKLINSPIQGSMADGLKRALVLLDQKLPDSALLVSIIHDEVIIEVSEEGSTEMKRIIDDCLIAGMESIISGVPIEVSSEISETWAKSKKNI